ncbi:uncharacterized protein LOC131599138 [Vicia villosa]|uniref:uncharacterized protein LOC131599138 n=1 Tax=Vicia villosa TaxID=3911 RepID=UPI00273A962C|nr:uncharacterized protein LOC131599138 [Vicia villosa]
MQKLIMALDKKYNKVLDKTIISCPRLNYGTVGVKGEERNVVGEVLLKCDSIGGDKLKEKSEGERWESGKDNHEGSSSAGISDTADLKEYIMISSDSEREMSPIYEELEEEY